ncbi:hypothetical protein GYT97_04475 [Lactobacillus mellis]|uniref:hypothetical protein n=1 Tax=Bombilactobacillus mellis TaxID=1218508 RepID=UPI0015805738|nr:hypothetical protein [Bombilactobacillus mellis]MCT6841333.1 hypothetical protein [Bombilactobacillus mellis]MCT6857155.1 hypothetical protein [Bombilactobacillus mellis]MCT6872806.1 hypothetical protein [Bombilactobacillus mellis]NUG39136.1 hypothetical protein [Bombilactobacillus mellis]NUG66906.1 hypothetical protein [Bombilactobacillus mellis]
MAKLVDYDAEMMNIDRQILQLFVQKLDLAQKAVQQKLQQKELLATRGEDIEADATQLELSQRPEYRAYLRDLLRDLRIITRQYQALLYQKNIEKKD